MATVGFHGDRVWRSIVALGLPPGSGLLLVNSLPEKPEAVQAMKSVSCEAWKLGIRVAWLWLNPAAGPYEAAATIRSFAESSGAEAVAFSLSGGLRWLTSAALLAAMTLKSLEAHGGPIVEEVRQDFEVEISIGGESPPPLVLKPVPRLVDVTGRELEILRLLASKRKLRAKSIADGICSSDDVECTSNAKYEAYVAKVLRRLEEKGLVESERRGGSKLYSLSSLGIALAGFPGGDVAKAYTPAPADAEDACGGEDKRENG